MDRQSIDTNTKTANNLYKKILSCPDRVNINNWLNILPNLEKKKLVIKINQIIYFYNLFDELPEEILDNIYSFILNNLSLEIFFKLNKII